MQQKRLMILGSTGSIGVAALDVAEGLRDLWQVVGLGAGRRWRELAGQVCKAGARAAALHESGAAGDLRAACPPKTDVFDGPEALVRMVDGCEADFVLSAVVGAAGLPATVAAVERGLTVGLANKESLVIAGSVIMPRARQTGSAVLPVDSEHSAIFQALQSGRVDEVHKIYLTASGGPFRTWSRAQIEDATLEQALKHPTWQMGPKITIDSATMANKALEVLEAVHLFGVKPAQVEVLIHPESIVHSMVEFIDGSIIAQLGVPDMRTPIQYALTYPQRRNGVTQYLNWSQVRQLTFEAPDFEKFPALRLGFEAAQRGGNSGAVYNAANEAAVDAFRAGKIRFVEIPRLIARALQEVAWRETPTLDELLETDRATRVEVAKWMA